MPKNWQRPRAVTSCGWLGSGGSGRRSKRHAHRPAFCPGTLRSGIHYQSACADECCPSSCLLLNPIPPHDSSLDMQSQFSSQHAVKKPQPVAATRQADAPFLSSCPIAHVYQSCLQLPANQPRLISVFAIPKPAHRLCKLTPQNVGTTCRCIGAASRVQPASGH